MDPLSKTMEALCLPIREVAGCFTILFSKPASKLWAELTDCCKSRNVGGAVVCIVTGVACILMWAALTSLLLPALKAVLVAKFAVSPFIATGAAIALKSAFVWGFGKIVNAISRKGASNSGCKP